MPKTTQFKVGPIVIGIEGTHFLTDWAADAFSPLNTAQQPAQLIFRIVDKPPRLTGQTVVGEKNIRVGNNAVWIRTRHFDLLAERADGIRVDLYPRDQSPLWWRSLKDPEEAWKIMISHGASLDMHLLKDFAYGILPLFLQCALLERGAALIHAGAVSVGNRAMLFPAWGGTGKSSLVSEMLLKGQASFLADDHTIIERNGTVHLYTVPIHCYAYHFKQQPELERRGLGPSSASDRLLWRLGKRLRPHRVVRWIPPQQLFGADRLQSSSQLAEVVLMFRGAVPKPLWERAEPQQLAQVATAIILQEVKLFTERLCSAQSGWTQTPLLTLQQVYSGLETILTEAFSRVDCHRLFIPNSASRDELLSLFREKSGIVASAMPNRSV